MIDYFFEAVGVGLFVCGLKKDGVNLTASLLGKPAYSRNKAKVSSKKQEYISYGMIVTGFLFFMYYAVELLLGRA